MPNKKEEITDLISDEGIMKLVKGQVLTFQKGTQITSLKITKLDKKNKRVWAEHVDLIGAQNAMSHEDHILDRSNWAIQQFTVPFCEDCKVPISKPATEEGNVKMDLRRREEREGGQTANV